jgi:hypothetical protein
MVKRKTERDDPEPPKLVAEKVLRRLAALDLEMRNLDAFCVLLKDLNARLIAEKPVVEGLHANAIRMVRAGILRAALGSVMACLDPTDQNRGNRASVGGILGLLKDAEFATTTRPAKTTLADGSVHDISVITIKTISVDGRVLHDVDAGVADNEAAPILLGLGALNRLGPYTIGDGRIVFTGEPA